MKCSHTFLIALSVWKACFGRTGYIIGGKILNIKQLEYFATIVENDFNLSLASAKLHISQPALSKYVRAFEEQENINLFIRSKGRLIALTEVGRILYENALIILKNYSEMMVELREQSKTIKGTVRIGIPPLIITVLFTELLQNLKRANPGINFEIIEYGAYELRKMLILNEIDFAVLLKPTDLNPKLFEEQVLYQDQLSAFMSVDNELSKQEKLEWKDLKGHELAIFDSSFMIHHMLVKRLSKTNINPTVILESSLWDFLLSSVRESKLITILPSPIKERFELAGVTEVHFKDPILWQVVLTYPVKQQYSKLESFTQETFVSYFADSTHNASKMIIT